MTAKKRRKRQQPGFRILPDHPEPTIAVSAASWRPLLEGAALGMSALLQESGKDSEPASGQMFPIELHRTDFDAMLTAWLDELLHQCRVHHLLPVRVEILQLDLEADCKLTAMVEASNRPADWQPRLHAVAAPLPRARRTREGLTCEIHFRPSG